MAGARTRAAEKRTRDELRWAEPAAPEQCGRLGPRLKALWRKELAAIREAQNALAVGGALVGLRRFSLDADGAVG